MTDCLNKKSIENVEYNVERNKAGYRDHIYAQSKS